MNYNFRIISYYSVASTTEAAFLMGGWDRSSSLDVIAKFENNNWSLYGDLQKARRGHGSITYGSQTIVIGGATHDGS